MSTQHTPGPLAVAVGENQQWISPPVWARLSAAMERDCEQRDELLAALREVYTLMANPSSSAMYKARDVARAAICEAEGAQ